MESQQPIKQQNIQIYEKLLGQPTENILRLFETVDIQQRSELWFKLRKLTASKIKECIDQKSFASFIIEQSSIHKKFVNNQYVHLGKNLEYLSQYFYSFIFNAQVLPMSIVSHKQYDFIGATPDGFSIRNNQAFLLEIKCPSKREIHSFGENIFKIVPYEYLLQCYLQMECCDIQYTDFWQSRIVTSDLPFESMTPVITFGTSKNSQEYDTVDIQLNNTGVCLKLYPKIVDKQSDEEYQTIYIYPKDIIQNDLQQQLQWVEENKKNYENYYNTEDKQYYYIKPNNYLIYWRFEKGHLEITERNKQWFRNNIQKMSQSWDYIVYFRQHQQDWQILNQNIKQYTSGYYEKNKKLIEERYLKFINDANELMRKNNQQ